MSKIIRISMLVGLILGGIVTLTPLGPVAHAQDPTIPTRTPTPGPQKPEVPPSPTSDSNNGGSNPVPTPTDTSVPQTQVTATSTVQSALMATATATATAMPLGAVRVPGEVDACELPPRIRAIDLTLVHAGPGSDYPLLGSLPALEERLIVGRAEFAEWWQILLIANEPQLLGWVSAITVDEFGDTGSVPLVAPPLLNGIAPTPGALWQPTPLPPACTPTPTPTATATATARATTTPTATTSAAGDLGTVGSGTSSDEEQAVIAEGNAAELDSQASTVGKQLPEGESADSSAVAATSAATTDATGGSGSSALMVPMLGIALIAGGIIIALLSRSKPPVG